MVERTDEARPTTSTRSRRKSYVLVDISARGRDAVGRSGSGGREKYHNSSQPGTCLL